MKNLSKKDIDRLLITQNLDAVNGGKDLDKLRKMLNPVEQKTKGNEMKKTATIAESLIGKKVIVRANVAGVHAGIVEDVDFSTQTVKLKNAYRLWRVYTRDSSGSISDVAANGLKPNGGHSIGAKLPTDTITNPPGLEIAEMTDDAYASIEAWKN